MMMHSKKDTAFEKISNDFEVFSNIVLEQLDLLEKIANSDQPNDPSKYFSKMKKNEEKIDSMELKISERIINAITLYQPMASDIRKLMASYRIIINLERIGDLVMNIVYKLKRMKHPQIYQKSSELIDNMLVQSINMVNKSILSFTNNDKDDAIWTIKNDSIVDDMNRKLLKKSILKGELPKEDETMILSIIDIKSILSCIERIADHATNIAEASIYALEGTDIRHQDIEENE